MSCHRSQPHPPHDYVRARARRRCPGVPEPKLPSDTPVLGDKVFILSLMGHAILDKVEGATLDLSGIHLGTPVFATITVGEHMFRITVEDARGH